ncbi:porin [Paraburkholderia sp. SARCC-3016]|uniref:porin n=1 Tax=Paraburkholderia sp. SARCC-3016 TaxID=3058611 RepID=UPI002809F7E1|nr:porin [Paraburkholderia sp. SARCC-3016]MDQ7977552.1 porin [Paraburkholderia sp. SARCC-3016]
MKKIFNAAAVAGGLGAIAAATSSAHAQSSVTLYGIIDAGISYVSNSATPTGHASLVKYADGVASGSRWGVRGTEDLGGGLKALFVLENGFSSADGSIGQGGALFGRQAYVGVSKNGIGTLAFGRQYSFSTDYLGANYTTGSQTPAGNYGWHINDVDQLSASRINNAVKFSSANISGLTFGAMYGFSNRAGAFAGTPTVTAGGASQQGASSAYSFGANYAQGPFGIGAAYTNIRYPNGATPPFSVSIANVNTGGLRDLETYGIGARVAIGAGLVWGNWTHTTFEPLTGASSRLNNYEIGGRYGFTPALAAGLGYTFSDLDDRFSGKWHQVTGALDYALSKRTDVYLLAVYQIASGSNTVAGRDVPVQAQIGTVPAMLGTSGAGANNQVATRVGLRHRF